MIPAKPLNDDDNDDKGGNCEYRNKTADEIANIHAVSKERF